MYRFLVRPRLKRKSVHTFSETKVTKKRLTNAEKEKKLISLCLKQRLKAKNYDTQVVTVNSTLNYLGQLLIQMECPTNETSSMPGGSWKEGTIWRVQKCMLLALILSSTV